MSPRAKTAEEVRAEFLDHLHSVADYWSMLRSDDAKAACDGLVFSILNVFDGTSAALPAMDIVLRPHGDDKDFCIKENEDWYEPGMVINECHMHDEWYKK